MGLATLMDVFSEFWAASDLGVTSPNTKIKIVIAIVEIKAPLLPYKSIAIDVAMADAPMLTTLFPIKIAPNNLFGFSTSLLIIFAFFTLSSVIRLSLILLRETRAVSDAEKNAESPIRINKIINSQNKWSDKIITLQLNID